MSDGEYQLQELERRFALWKAIKSGKLITFNVNITKESNMSHEKVSKRFTKAYAAEGGVGDPITIITLLITFLAKFLESCAAKDVKELAKEHPVFVQRQMVKRAMEEGHSRKEARIIAEAGMTTINQSSASDLENL